MTDQTSQTVSDDVKISDEIRRFEIQHFWTRSLFFAGILAANFAAIQEYKTDDKIITVVLWCFGLICALAWTLANRGGKFWQETWEPHGYDHTKKSGKNSNTEPSADSSPVVPASQDISRWKSVLRRVRKIWDGRRYSPSRLAIAVSDGAVVL